MLCPPASAEFVQLPTASAFSLCDGLLRMAHRLITELPEPELRSVRRTLDTLSMRIDHLLDSAELDLDLNLEGLSMDPGKSYRFHPRVFALVSSISERGNSDVPGTEDFGAIVVSTSVCTSSDSSGSAVASPSNRYRNTISRVPAIAAPPPTPVPARVSTPATFQNPGPFPLVLSARDNVGFPDYTHHPEFVCPGL
jgi:hypothetical protein